MARYEKIEDGYLGSGAFGSVSKVKRVADERVVACKTIRFFNNAIRKKTVEDECTILARLQHPNIVRFYEVKWEALQARLYMEYCEGGNLDKFVRNNDTQGWPSEKDVWRISFQLAAAVAYCHEGILRKPTGGFYTDADPGPWQPIWHRDIKPENVFVRKYADGEIAAKLGDFGLGVILFDQHQQLSYGGTNIYIPPEITRTHPLWSNKSDVYSLGCTLHFLCLGSPPFDSHRTRLGQESTSRLEYPNWLSSNLSQWVQSCFADNSSDRPEARALFQEAERHVESKDLQRVTLSPAGSILGDTLPSALLPKGSEIMENTKRWKNATSDSQLSGSWHDEERLGKGIQTPGSASPIANSSERYGIIQSQLNEYSPSGVASSTTPRELKDSPDPTFRSDGQGVQSQTSSSPKVSSVSRPPVLSPQVTSPDSQRLDSAPIPETLPRVSVDSYFLQNPRSEEHDPAPRHQISSDTRTLANESFGSDQGTMSNNSVSRKDTLIRNIAGLVDELPNRYPYFNVFYIPSDEYTPHRHIHTEQLTRAVAVSDSVKEGNANRQNRQSKGGIYRIFLGSRTPRPESPDLHNVHQVSLEASESYEYLLLNDREWFESALERINVLSWILEKWKVEKRVYLIVGYLTYLDAKVSNETNSELGNKQSMLVPVGDVAGISASTGNSWSGRSSNSGRNMFVRDGEQVQAGYFREITLPGVSVKDLDRYSPHDVRRFCKVVLGDVITVYFWGPKKRPLQ